jgi:hypothetical protein
MGVHADACPGKAAPVDEAGVVGGIRDDEVLWASEGRDDAQVGLVASGEEQGRRKAEERREAFLERPVFGEVARDEAGGAGSEA